MKKKSLYVQIIIYVYIKAKHVSIYEYSFLLWQNLGKAQTSVTFSAPITVMEFHDVF